MASLFSTNCRNSSRGGARCLRQPESVKRW
jgi:hypothetical protein